MMGNPRCHWVRGRLPLLVGDELRGLDRRRVERHLIGCPQCRQHQAALGQALRTLHTAAATTPVQNDAPSLWPALARQIRESRRPTPAPTLASLFFPMTSWLRLNPLPALSLGLVLFATATVSLGIRQQINTAQNHIRANERPLAQASAVAGHLPIKTAVSDPHRELPAAIEPSIAESSSPPRFDFDSSLEHGRPMPPDPREARDTKATY